MCNYNIEVLSKENINKYIDSLVTNYENAKRRLKKLTKYQWQDQTYNYDFFLNIINNDKQLFIMFTKGCEVISSVRLLLDLEATYDKIYDGMFKYDNYTTIHTICTNESYLNNGVAKSLIKYCEEYSKKVGYKSIRIDTHPKNEVMKLVCEKLNYTYSGIIYLSKLHDDCSIRYLYEKKL